jgi:RNA polymerase sigma factor (sigma-70 family)
VSGIALGRRRGEGVEQATAGGAARSASASPPVPPFQSFLDHERTVVYRFLLGAVGPDEADDCFQETFLSALRAYPRLRDGANLRSWILTIATRKAIDAGRARARRPVVDEEAVRCADERGATTVTAAGLSASAVDRDDPLWRAVDGLPPRQRAAVIHRHVLGLPYEEIARAMRSSEETARANVSQGMRKLRSMMEAT